MEEPKNRKAIELDDSSDEVLKLLDEEHINLLLMLFTRVYNTGNIYRQQMDVFGSRKLLEWIYGRQSSMRRSHINKKKMKKEIFET